MFDFFKNLKLAISLGKAFKEVKEFIKKNKDKKEKVLFGISKITEGLEIIREQIPVISDLVLLINTKIQKIFSKDK